MVTKFIQNSNTVYPNEMYMGNKQIERVATYKMLRVIITGEPNWDIHGDYKPLWHQRDYKCSDFLKELMSNLKLILKFVKVLLDPSLTMCRKE